MTDELMDRIEAIFHKALKIEPAGRPDYLEKACGNDKSLREKVEILLKIRGDAFEFFEKSPWDSIVEQRSSDADTSTDLEPEADLPFERIGEFRLIRRLGEGGMGVVFLAHQETLSRKVALKVLPAHLSFSDKAVQKFRREAEAGGRQSHPGIVAIYAVGHDQNVHYIAQELVGNGATLADLFADTTSRSEQPPGYFRNVARTVVDVADALEHAHHAGVIHRDIKPSNILLTKSGHTKVTDFGLAMVEDALALSRTGEFAGTPYYMSPEQAMSKRIGIDHRTDIYSLGVTLYELLTLKRPFDGKTSQEVLKKILLIDPPNPNKQNPRVPSDLGTICLKAMEKLPERRYATMTEFADDLRRFLSGDVILAKPAGFVRRTVKRLNRNPVLSMAIGVALLAVVVLVAWGIWYFVQMKIHFDEIVRYSDMDRIYRLRAEADDLWPAYPEKIDDLERWLTDVKELVDHGATHEATLRDLNAKRLLSEEEENLHARLTGLISGIASLTTEGTGLISKVEERLDFALTVKDVSLVQHAEAWDRAVSSIGNRRECPLYQGLKLAPQLGFIPIGRDPRSGLWEFAHLQTGEIADRDGEGNLELTIDTGLVFILIPGGSFDMGAARPPEGTSLDALSPNEDPAAVSNEVPVHRVSVGPFLISKYEMTQGQWLKIKGVNPSCFVPGEVLCGKTHTLLHPVETVHWSGCNKILGNLKLRLPSEAEWEYAARAGTTTVFWTGNEKHSLEGAANLFDLCSQRYGTPALWPPEKWLDDGYAAHAPVGSFRANPFGLHDVCGNVWEWCQDSFTSYANTPCDGSAFESDKTRLRVYRGGSWLHPSDVCRSSFRFKSPMQFMHVATGVRPAASIHDPED